MGKILKSIHPDDDQHYSKMGLTRNQIEIWEDDSYEHQSSPRFYGADHDPRAGTSLY